MKYIKTRGKKNECSGMRGNSIEPFLLPVYVIKYIRPIESRHPRKFLVDHKGSRRCFIEYWSGSASTFAGFTPKHTKGCAHGLRVHLSRPSSRRHRFRSDFERLFDRVGSRLRILVNNRLQHGNCAARATVRLRQYLCLDTC